MGHDMHATRRIGHRAVAILTLLTALAVGAPPAEAVATGRIIGRVASTAFGPMPGMTVHLDDLDAGTSRIAASTDHLGRYQIDDLPAGRYRIWAAAALDHLTTFFPATTDPASSLIQILDPGETIADVNIDARPGASAAASILNAPGASPSLLLCQEPAVPRIVPTVGCSEGQPDGADYVTGDGSNVVFHAIPSGSWNAALVTSSPPAISPLTVLAVSNGDRAVCSFDFTGSAVCENEPRTPPARPEGVRAVAGDRAVIVTWTNSMTSELVNIVERRKLDTATQRWSAFLPVSVTVGNVSEFTDTVPDDGIWGYRVTAASILGGARSTPTRVTVGVPNAPSDVSAVRQGQLTANLVWTDHSSNEANFVVERRQYANGGWIVGWTVVATLAADTTQYLDALNGPGNGWGVYQYRVRAVNEWGSRVSALTPSCRIRAR